MSHRVLIAPIDEVVDHPNADRLSICRILGNQAVVGKDGNGNHSFSSGDRAIYVPIGARLSPDLLRQHGLWDWESGKGKLGGSDGDVVAPVDRRGTISSGLVWRLPDELAGLPDLTDVTTTFGITCPKN